jgi:hypothetical protein
MTDVSAGPPARLASIRSDVTSTTMEASAGRPLPRATDDLAPCPQATVGPWRPPHTRGSGPLDVIGSRRSAASSAADGPFGVQSLPHSNMPLPHARTPPSQSGGWQARMAKGRPGRSGRQLLRQEELWNHSRCSAPARSKRARTQSPARTNRGEAAQPAISGWSGDWQTAGGDPRNGSEVVVVFSILFEKQMRLEWHRGTVSIDPSGQALATFADDYKLKLTQAKRLNPGNTDPGTVVERQWCLLSQAFP